MKLSRNKTQESLMFILYDALIFTSLDLEFDVEKVLKDYFGEPYEEIDIFAKEVIIKSLRYKVSVIEELQSKMPDWKFERLNRVAQAILLLAVTHYHYVEQVDKRIVIDNAVRLAKKYLDDGDYKLINAVLDATL